MAMVFRPMAAVSCPRRGGAPRLGRSTLRSTWSQRAAPPRTLWHKKFRDPLVARNYNVSIRNAAAICSWRVFGPRVVEMRRAVAQGMGPTGDGPEGGRASHGF